MSKRSTLRAPRQRRSLETLERLVAAADALLARRDFEAIEVDEIVREARSSVGSFYARFPSKDALLPHLYDRYDRELHARLPALLAAERWDALPLPSLCRRVAELLVGQMRERRGLLRAVTRYARAHPSAIGDALRAERSALLAGPARLFARHRAAIRHPDPERAVAFALFALGAVCREAVLFGDAPHAALLALPDAAAARAAGDLLHAYLVTPPVDA